MGKKRYIDVLHLKDGHTIEFWETILPDHVYAVLTINGKITDAFPVKKKHIEKIKESWQEHSEAE